MNPAAEEGAETGDFLQLPGGLRGRGSRTGHDEYFMELWLGTRGV